MSKRFLDTGFLDQKWIRKLSPEKKIFLVYLMLKCDNGGIIDLDFEDASFWIGKRIDNVDFLPKGYLILIDVSGKYFMPKFIEWQYPDLSSNKHIVVQARQILEKHNLINSDFTLILDNVYVKITKDLSESQITGIGKGIGIGIGISKEGEFEKFWDEYHKITKLKKTDYQAALKYWNKLKTDEQQKAIDNIQLYFDSLNDKKYCKKARTYLADKNFNDEFKLATHKVFSNPDIIPGHDGWGRKLESYE